MSRSTVIISTFLVVFILKSNAFSADKANSVKPRLRVTVSGKGDVEISSSQEIAKNIRSQEGKLIVFCDHIRITQQKKNCNSFHLVFVGSVRGRAGRSRFSAAKMTLLIPDGVRRLLNLNESIKESFKDWEC